MARKGPAKGKAKVKVTSSGKRVSYGQAGKAKGGGPRVKPGTSKGDAYCARSYAQKKKEYRKRILLDKWGEEVGHKINEGLIEIGFTEMMVEEALGHPDSINRTEYSFFIREQWVYNIGKYHYVYLEDGIVTAIQFKG